MAKEDRIGALWKRTSINPKAPSAKGEINPAKMEAEALKEIMEKLASGQKVKFALWANKWKAEDLNSPDPAVREKAHIQPDWHIELERDTRKPEAQGKAYAPKGAFDTSYDDVPFG